MRVFIADDEPLALRRMEILLSRRPWVEIAGTAQDGAAAASAIETTRPDAALLDIRMPGLDGFEVADLCRAGGGPEIIFVTAFDSFAVKAFQAAAVDYLLKPVDAARLDEALGRARAQLAARDARTRADELEALVRALRSTGEGGGPDLWIRDRAGAVRVEKSRIDWIEAEGDYVRIHAGGRSWLMRETMQGIEKQLDPRLFARVHRSAIVNMRAVARAAVTETRARVLTLTCGDEVRVGRAYESAVNAAMARADY